MSNKMKNNNVAKKENSNDVSGNTVIDLSNNNVNNTSNDSNASNASNNSNTKKNTNKTNNEYKEFDNNTIVEKDSLGLYNDVTNAANNLISNIRGKKPNSKQLGLVNNNNSNSNSNNSNSNSNNSNSNSNNNKDTKTYKGELNNSNSQNALNKNIDPEDVMLSKSVADVTKETRQQFFASASDLLVTQTALIFDKLLDLATYTTLGYHTMSKVTKEDLIDDLTQKRDVMVGVMKDPKGRKIVRDIAYVSAKILTVIIKAAEKPALEARDKLLNIIVSSTDKITAKGVILMKNLVKIVPGIGDLYIIADNGIQMTKAATEMAKSSTKAANVTTKSFTEMAENVSKIQKPLNSDFEFLEKNLEDFNKLREKIRKNTQMPNIDETTQNLKRAIHDIGKKATTQLNDFRNSLISEKSKAKPMFGGKTMKRQKLKSKSRRKVKHLKSSLKNKYSLKSCMKTPGCNLRNAIRKTKKKCVKFDL